MSEKKYHWYWITLRRTNQSGIIIFSSGCFKFNNKNITRAELLSEIEKSHFDPNNSAIINSMYLGWMSENEFLNN